MKTKSIISRAEGSPFIARDGAKVFELLQGAGVKWLSLAEGYLDQLQQAKPHYHEKTEEIYYILSGTGEIRLDDRTERIQARDAVYVPPGAIHALRNLSQGEILEVLAICSPEYSDEDIFFI